jgi:hypothetical protein
MTFDLIFMGDLTRELTQILIKETEMLKNLQIQDIKPLLNRKQAISLELEKQRALLLGNTELLKSVSADEKEYLRSIASDYDLAMVTYQEQLFKTQKVNSMLIHQIAEYIKDHVQHNRAYTNRGSKEISGMELARNTPAIKFNEQI